MGTQVRVNVDLPEGPEQISGQLLRLPLQLRGGHAHHVGQAAGQDHGLLHPPRQQHQPGLQQLPELLPPLHPQQAEADQEATADSPGGSQQPSGGICLFVCLLTALRGGSRSTVSLSKLIPAVSHFSVVIISH